MFISKNTAFTTYFPIREQNKKAKMSRKQSFQAANGCFVLYFEATTCFKFANQIKSSMPILFFPYPLSPVCVYP